MAALHVVSFSELSTAKQCSLKHELSYVDRWTKPLPPDDARQKGKWWHVALEAHYNEVRRAQKAKEPPSPAGCLQAAAEAIARAPKVISEMVMWMYEGYVKMYWEEDKAWQVLAVEHSANVRLPSSLPTKTKPAGRSRFVLKMKIDLIVRDRSTRNKNILVVDHKSAKDLPSNVMLELDDQFGLYTWGLRQMGKTVFGQVHNCARTIRLVADEKSPGATPLDERFRRTPLYRTEKELDIVALEAYQIASTRYTELATNKRKGLMSPRHTDPRNCAWMCDFREPCLAGRKGMDIRRFLRDAGFTTDPTRH